MDEAEADVLAYMNLPASHRSELHPTSPLERLNGEVKRRADAVGIFPNEVALPVWSAQNCRNRMMNGPCSAHAT